MKNPQTRQNNQIVEEIVNSVVGEESTNGHIVEEIVNSVVGEESTNSTNLTEIRQENAHNLDLVKGSEEIGTISEVEDTQERETNIEEFNLMGHLTELQQLLLICVSLVDLLAIKEIYPHEELIEAYNTLNLYERRQIRNLILLEQELINVSGQMMTACQLLSFFTGQPENIIKVGDKVLWCECSGHIESWSPFEVLEITDDGWVRLDIVCELVPLCELKGTST